MSKKVLVVDDNLESLDILKSIMEKEGYIIQTASSCAECLEQVESFRPEMVLLDVMLPDGLGTDVCMKIKSEDKNQDMFIILISGIKVSPEDLAFGIEIGASDYLTRPYHKRELLARIHSLFSMKEALVSSREKEPYDAFSRTSTSQTAKIYEQQTIDEAYPKEFTALTENYYSILLLLIEERIYKTESHTSEKVRDLTNQLGFLQAGAPDVINVHKAALKMIVKNTSAIKTYYVKEESRILLVEVMGYLLSYYRSRY